MKNLSCYIDESGQDTQGALFIVASAVTEDREKLLSLLETIERTSGKKKKKWADVGFKYRLAYIDAVLREPAFQGKLYFAVYYDTLDYADSTIDLTVKALKAYSQGQSFKASISVDGLLKTERDVFAVGVRRRDVLTKRVRGMDDQRDALIRLADAVCGFLRDVLDKQPECTRLMRKALQEGYLVNVEE